MIDKLAYSLLITFLTLMILGCTNNNQLDANHPKVKKILALKKRAYIEDQFQICRRDLLEKASIYVDSLISEEISYQLSDSIVFPPRPERPTWPGKIKLVDTLRAKPIF